MIIFFLTDHDRAILPGLHLKSNGRLPPRLLILLSGEIIHTGSIGFINNTRIKGRGEARYLATNFRGNVYISATIE